MDEIRFHTELYYDIQKMRIEAGNRLGQLERDGMDAERAKYLQDWIDERLVKVEKEIMGIAANYVKTEPVYLEFLKDVKGIGPVISACLISWLRPYFRDTVVCLECGHTEPADFTTHNGRHPDQCAECESEKILYPFSTISALWRYCGMDVRNGEAPRRQKGRKIDWNPRLRTLCWKISDSLIKVQGPYRERYLTAKDAYQREHPEPEPSGRKSKAGKEIMRYTKQHIHLLAKRKVVKPFLAELWLKWRELEGLPVRGPYNHQ